MLLGNLGKSHTPHNIIVYKDTIDGLTDNSQDNRINNFKLREAACSILADTNVSAICKCGKNIVGSEVSIVKHEKTGKVHYSGLQTCGSVWSCPVCSSKVSERRRIEIKTACDSWLKEGGEILLVTFTFPHSKDDSLKDLLIKQASAFKKFKGRKAYTKHLRSFYGIKGTIKSSEVTYSKSSGWHPHVHELWFVDRGHSLINLKNYVYDAWASACVDSGLERPSFNNGIDIRSGDYAYSYVAKWGLDYELSKCHIKKGKSKTSKTPFQFLSDFDDGDMQAGVLFRQYAEAFKGRRQLFWSKGLKKYFNIISKSDIEVLNEQEEQAKVIITINYFDWRKIVNHKLQAYILNLAELRGAYAVYSFIDKIRHSPPNLRSGSHLQLLKSA